MVALEGHAIVSPLFEKFCTELFLCVERVAGQHRAFEIKLFDSFNGARDFVFFFFNPHLTDAQTWVRIDDIERVASLSSLSRRAHGLPVDTDD